MVHPQECLFRLLQLAVPIDWLFALLCLFKDVLILNNRTQVVIANRRPSPVLGGITGETHASIGVSGQIIGRRI